jgi:DNA repair protein RecO (recombination protein O)
MQWNDLAIVLSVRRFAEHGAVASMFAREHGLYHGVAKAALSKAQRGIFQPGNVVAARWSARLSEHIGSWQCELDTPLAAWSMQDAKALAALNAVCAMIPLAMHDRDPHPLLYDNALRLLEQIAAGKPWQADYVRFELCLLTEAGFGLDLTACAATGSYQELIYVSPKSGCAVSATAGEPYRDKLLPLPAFLRDSGTEDMRAIADGLTLTGYFLRQWLLAAIGKTMPAARDRVVQILIHRHPERA